MFHRSVFEAFDRFEVREEIAQLIITMRDCSYDPKNFILKVTLPFYDQFSGNQSDSFVDLLLFVAQLTVRFYCQHNP